MTYLEFLSLMLLYMAWVVLLLRMMLSDEASLRDRDEPRESGRHPATRAMRPGAGRDRG